MNLDEYEESSEVVYYIADQLHKLSEKYQVDTEPFIMFSQYKDQYDTPCFELRDHEMFIDCIIEQSNCAFEHVKQYYKNLKPKCNVTYYEEDHESNLKSYTFGGKNE